MRTLRCLLPAVVAGAFCFSAHAEELRSFKELCDLIRKESPGINPEELDRLATQGLIEKLGNRAMLLPPESPAETARLAEPMRTFDNGYAYIRVAQVRSGLAGEFKTAFDSLSKSNKLKGLVLDLRFTDGGDYAAGAELADLFVGKAGPLLDWGEGPFKSREKTNAITLHMAILINRQTAIASEALAAALREAGSGLLIGDVTAGRASRWHFFNLADGTRLALAGQPVEIGGGKPLSARGVVPDISVKVSAADEKEYLNNPYFDGRGATPQSGVMRRRLSEADLVRERNESLNRSAESAEPQTATAVSGPTVRDPALARALDLLKGLAVVRPQAAL